MKGRILKKFRTSPSLILLYLIVLIPVLTMCYFLYADYTYREEEEIRKNEQMAKVLAQNLDSYLENLKATLASVSTLPDVKQENRQNRQNIQNIFRNLMLADNQVFLYWQVDVEGNIIAKYPNNLPDKTNKSFMKHILQGNSVITEPHKGLVTGLEVITVSSLIKDDNGKVIGAIGASIPLTNLQKKLLIKVGSTGYPILFTKSGIFLAHPKREEISKKVKPDDPITKAIQKGGSGTLDIVAPFDGKRKFFSYVSLKQANWVVIVIQPLSEFHAQVVKLFTRNTIIICLVIFLLILAAYYLMLFRKREEEARILQAEKLSIVGELAAGMAHEIRNPLTTIKGFAQLASDNQNGLSDEYLEIIISEVNRIESIVKETMLLAKPTPVEFKPVDINQLLNDVFALMEPQTHLKEINLNLSIEPSLPLVKGESNQLKQVFINLIRNSIDAAPDKGGKITICAKLHEEAVLISVKDNGSGISQEVLQKLGSPFISTKETGTGLGLMVTYRIIQNHNGKISVKSKIGIGTTFTIELPIML